MILFSVLSETVQRESLGLSRTSMTALKRFGLASCSPFEEGAFLRPSVSGGNLDNEARYPIAKAV